MRKNFFDQIRNNKIKSILMIFLIVGILLLVGYVIALVYNPAYTMIFVSIALLLAVSQALFAYYRGDKFILRMMKAKEAEKPEHTRLINMVEGLSIGAGIPTPKIYVIKNPDINAFATGRDPKHASVAVTTGALEKLNKAELEGVMAHELGHVKNYDIKFATLVVVLVGIVAIISGVFLRSFIFGGGRRSDGGAILVIIGIVLAIIAPIAAKLVQLSISRKREFLADAYSAKLTRYPSGLADALRKISNSNEGKLKVDDSIASLFIASPKKRIKRRVGNLFSTHPPVEERIKILENM